MIGKVLALVGSGNEKANRIFDYGLLFLLFAIYYEYLNSIMGTPLCDDCMGYIKLMRPLNFHDYLRVIAQSKRSFSIPVIFSWFGQFNLGAELSIVKFQSHFQFFAWILFSTSLASLMNGWHAKRLVFFLALLCMFGRGLPDLNRYILSDSLSMGMQLVFATILVRFDIVSNILRIDRLGIKYLFLPVFALFAAFAIFARDSNALMWGIAYLFLPFVAKPADKKNALIAAAVVVALSGISLWCSSSGLMSMGRVNNIEMLTGRILPDEAAREYFKRRGLPNAEKIDRLAVERLSKWNKAQAGASPADVTNEGDLLKDRKQVAELVGDFALQVRSIYVWYLISHPTKLVSMAMENIEVILDPRLESATNENTSVFTDPCDACAPTVISKTKDISLLDAFPLWLLSSLIICSVLFWSFHEEKRKTQKSKQLFWSGAILLLSGFSCAYGAFLGEYWEQSEVMRHCLAGSVFFKLGCLAVIAAAVDTIWRQENVADGRCDDAAGMPQLFPKRGIIDRFSSSHEYKYQKNEATKSG
jgi:hypothetical protein